MSATQVALTDGANQDFPAPAGSLVPTLAPREPPQALGDDQLKLLARALGRQAARRHLARGRALIETAICLALGALIVGAALYAGLFHLGSR